jgi:predicted RNA binding protein YcfA (HicA-like mRNA interferase family)
VRIPRDIDGQQLTRALRRLGYETVRQKGSHIRITTQQNGVHHITVPAHSPITVGTLAAILDDIAAHFRISRDELLTRLFG